MAGSPSITESQASANSTMSDGVASVYLNGQCSGQGAAYTIGNIIMVNLKQFTYIQFVKIYDQNGTTEKPDGASDSIPTCLDPAFAPSRRRLRSPQAHPLHLRRRAPPHRLPPRAPRQRLQYTLANVFFVDKQLYDSGAVNPAVAGKRWVLSNNVPANVLTQYFIGPGFHREIHLWLDRPL